MKTNTTQPVQIHTLLRVQTRKQPQVIPVFQEHLGRWVRAA
jgi:hypothetical protein